MNKQYTDTDHLKIIIKVAAEHNNGASLNAKQVRIVAEMFDECERLREREAKLVEALKYYADPDNWSDAHGWAVNALLFRASGEYDDGFELAKQAIEGEKSK